MRVNILATGHPESRCEINTECGNYDEVMSLCLFLVTVYGWYPYKIEVLDTEMCSNRGGSE